MKNHRSTFIHVHCAIQFGGCVPSAHNQSLIEHILRLTREEHSFSDRARTETKEQTCCVKSEEDKMFTCTKIYIIAETKAIHTNSETSTASCTWERVLPRNCLRTIINAHVLLDLKTLSPDLTLTELWSLWCLTKLQACYNYFIVYTCASSSMHATEHKNLKNQKEHHC